jgi:N-acetylneuraminic acid mutarotase
LLTDGRVLVAGGQGRSLIVLGTAELYDPATGTWSATRNLVSPLVFHRATLLDDGRVLLVGGIGNAGDFKRAQIYDPSTATWASTGQSFPKRAFPTATVLEDNTVLMTGGDQYFYIAVANSQIYNSQTSAWTNTAELTTPRYSHTATLLLDGRVLIVGGTDVPGWLWQPRNLASGKNSETLPPFRQVSLKPLPIASA